MGRAYMLSVVVALALLPAFAWAQTSGPPSPDDYPEGLRIDANEDEWDTVSMNMRDVFDANGINRCWAWPNSHYIGSADYTINRRTCDFVLAPILDSNTGTGTEFILVYGETIDEIFVHKIVLDVEPVDDPPVASPDTHTIRMNTDSWKQSNRQQFKLDDIFKDVDGSIEYAVSSNPPPVAGSALFYDRAIIESADYWIEKRRAYLSDEVNHWLVINPHRDGSDTAHETITVTGTSSGQSATYTVTLDIEPVDDALVASPASRTIAADEDGWDAVEVDLATVFSDREGDTITYSASPAPSSLESATYTLDGTAGVLVVTPRDNGNTGTGTEVIIVTGTAGGQSATYTVTLDIEPVDDALVASPATRTVNRSEDAWNPITIGLSSIFSDGEGDAIAYSVSSVPPTLESATYGLDSQAATLTVTPRPDGNTGSTTETVTVTGTAGGRSATYTLTLDIEPVRDAPRFADGVTEQTVIGNEDEFAVEDIDMTSLFVHPDGDLLTYDVTSGSISLVGIPGTLRSLSVVEYEVGNNVITFSRVDDANTGPSPAPEGGFDTGLEYITITATDQDGQRVDYELTFDIEPVNDAPELAGGAAHPAITGSEDAWGPATVDLAAVFSDVDGDSLSYAVSDDGLTAATHSVSGNDLTLTRVAGAHTGEGTESLTVTATDSGGLTSPAYTITLEIESAASANTAPALAQGVTSPHIVSEDEDGYAPITVDLDQIFTDDGSLAYSASPASGDPSLSAVTYSINHVTNVMTITPVKDAHTGTSTETLTIAATDVFGLTAYHAITFDVGPVDDPPVASPTARTISADEDGWDAVEVGLATIFSDADGDAIAYSASPAPGTLESATYALDEATLTVTPRPDGNTGSTTETVTVTGTAGGQSATYAITLDIDPVDDGLIADPPAHTITGNEDAWYAVEIDLSEIFSDIDDGAVTYAPLPGQSGSGKGSYAVGNPSGTLVIPPRFTDIGGSTITYTAAPSSLSSATYDLDSQAAILTIMPKPDGNTGNSTEVITVTGTSGAHSATYTITLDIEPVDDAPVASPTSRTVTEDEDDWDVITIDLATIFSDEEDDEITYTALPAPSSLKSATYTLDGTAGVLVVTPRDNGNTGTGTDVITVTGTAGGQSATYIITLDIEPKVETLQASSNGPVQNIHTVTPVEGSTIDFDAALYLHDPGTDPAGQGSYETVGASGHSKRDILSGDHTLKLHHNREADFDAVLSVSPLGTTGDTSDDFEITIHVDIQPKGDRPLFRTPLAATFDVNVDVDHQVRVYDPDMADADRQIECKLHNKKSAAMPEGLALNSDCTITGTPLVAGNHTVRIVADTVDDEALNGGDNGLRAVNYDIRILGDSQTETQNKPPVANPDTLTITGDEGEWDVITIDLATIFSDEEDDTITYSASPRSSVLESTTYTLNNATGILVIMPTGQGNTGSDPDVITVTGTAGGQTATYTITLDIETTSDSDNPLLATSQLEVDSYDIEIRNDVTAETYSFSPSVSAAQTAPSESQGHDSDEWKRKPTLGVAWDTGSQLVSDGFTFNGYTLDITDNWHTDFERTTSIIGESNNVVIKSYAPDGHDRFSLGLGIPRIGMQHEAETEIIIDVGRDHESETGFMVESIDHMQGEDLIDEDYTTVSLSMEPCSSSSTDDCLVVEINFRIMAPLHHDVVAVSVVDNKRRITTTYINDGVSFEGESFLDPNTVEFFLKKTSQDKGVTVVLTQPDRRLNEWYDMDGNLWEANGHGAYVQIERNVIPERNDPAAQVMTRQHSAFGEIIHDEQMRAIELWDTGLVTGVPDSTFSYDLERNNDGRLTRLAPLMDQEEGRAIYSMMLEHGLSNNGGIQMHRTGEFVSVKGHVDYNPSLELELRMYQYDSSQITIIPVADDGSFDSKVSAGEDLKYAYLSYDGKVLGTLQ